MEINWWFRYEDDDAYDVDANWCPDCGEMRGVCTCGPLCQECGSTMTLESSYENEARVVVHQYWCETCRVQKWAYDKGAVLNAALERGDLHLIRVKRDLDVREFERQLGQGFIHWADAEQVNDIVIAIDTRLGDLLIMEGQS